MSPVTIHDPLTVGAVMDHKEARDREQITCAVVWVDGTVQEVPFPEDRNDHLEFLQTLVTPIGVDVLGSIEALQYRGHPRCTSYVNEEGKFDPRCELNRRATSEMDGYLFEGDWIDGEWVVCGFDPSTGDHTALPQDVRVSLGLDE